MGVGVSANTTVSIGMRQEGIPRYPIPQDSVTNIDSNFKSLTWSSHLFQAYLSASQLRKAVTGSRGTYGSFTETPSLQKPSGDYAEATKLTPTKRIRSQVHMLTLCCLPQRISLSVLVMRPQALHMLGEGSKAE